MKLKFWSSVDLTGNQTRSSANARTCRFWSSVDLTGNQTAAWVAIAIIKFWSSVDLTGNQTQLARTALTYRFGAVSI